MNKYTADNPIFNPNPEVGQYRRNGWKTINGWNYNAKKLSYCLKNNGKYSWHITINIHHILDDDEHKAVWKHAARIFRRHFTAFWMREPDTSNHVNYHLLVKSEISHARMTECIQSAFPQLSITLCIAKVKPKFVALIDYIAKHGRHSDKRVYFAKTCTLNKHGTIGEFWCKPTKQIWQKCIDESRQISAALNECDDIRRAAKYLHWCCDGHYSFRGIRRGLALQYPNNKNEVEALARQCENEYANIVAHHDERNER